MSKVWGVEETVAERFPAESVVPFSVFWILAFTVGLPEGKRSKLGPLFRAPCQWVI